MLTEDRPPTLSSRPRTAFLDRWALPLAVSVIIKMVLLSLLVLERNGTLLAPWYTLSGDWRDYCQPIESLLAGHGYAPDFRMPGYGAAFLIVRLFLPTEAAYQGMVWWQVLMDALSVVLLAKVALRITGHMRAALCVFVLAAISTYTTVMDLYILTESFSWSALIAATFLMTKEGAPGPLRLLSIGSLLTWLVFLKPVFLPMLGLFGAVLLFRTGADTWVLRSRRLLTLLLPCLVVEGAWIVRNHMVHHRTIVLTSSVVHPDLMAKVNYPLMRLMQAYGCSFVWWDSYAEVRNLNLRSVGSAVEVDDRQPPFPNYIRTSTCDSDTLAAIAADVALAVEDTTSRSALDRVTRRCDRCIDAFRKEHPFHYHVTARLRMLKLFVLQSGTSALLTRPWNELGPIGKGVKLFYSLLYICSVLLGTVGAAWALFQRGRSLVWRLVPAIALYGLCIFPFGVRMTENRYFTTVHPFFILFSVHVVFLVLAKVTRWRTPIDAP